MASVKDVNAAASEVANNPLVELRFTISHLF